MLLSTALSVVAVLLDFSPSDKMAPSQAPEARTPQASIPASEEWKPLTASLKLESLFFFNVCLFFERETEHARGRGRERERDTEPGAGSRLRAASTEPNTGLEPTDREIMTRAEVGRLTD